MNLDTSRSGTEVVVNVAGELDANNAYDVYSAVVAEVEGGAGVVVVDLSSVTFIDSVGLGMLVRTRDDLTTDLHAQLILRRPSPNVHRILTLTALLDHFVVTD